MPRSSSPPKEGRIGEDHVHPVAVADLVEWKTQAVFRIDLRRFETVQEQVHLAEEVGKRFGLAAEYGLFLKHPPVLHGLDLFAQVVERLHQETAGAASRVKDRLAEARGSRASTMKRTTGRGV